jgi:hypothetical protein
MEMTQFKFLTSGNRLVFNRINKEFIYYSLRTRASFSAWIITGNVRDSCRTFLQLGKLAKVRQVYVCVQVMFVHISLNTGNEYWGHIGKICSWDPSCQLPQKIFFLNIFSK